MVQNETNDSVQVPHTPKLPTSASNPNTYQMRLFDNNINLLSESSGEKKKKVGNYIISKTIGEGSFAKVRLGFHIPTQQKVAVKVINKREVVKRNYLRANLRREASMMQRMQHPNVIQLYEVMETENCYYIVMELIDGTEFVKYLSKKRVLDENETRQYIRQIVSAVDHMHEAKVVHRDIKLQNFMLDNNYNLVIIDFGLSNSLDERDFLNTQCGSPAYAAPEIFAHRNYRFEVDVWSIGVNMYAMLAGKLPFKVENRSKNLAKLHACILKGCEIPNFLSADCQDLLKRLLDPTPNLRIKMSEIISHPWINYQTFPIQLIHFKPYVDAKEIKQNVVKYLIHKYGFTENEINDAIINRKPITVKAMYYLAEKFLLQKLKDSNEFEKRGAAQITSRHSERIQDLSSERHANLPRQTSNLLPKRSANSSRRINIPKSESAATQRSSVNSGLSDIDTNQKSDVTVSKISRSKIVPSKSNIETPKINYEAVNTMYNKKYTTDKALNDPYQTIKDSKSFKSQPTSKYKTDLSYAKSENYDHTYNKNNLPYNVIANQNVLKQTSHSPARTDIYRGTSERSIQSSNKEISSTSQHYKFRESNYSSERPSSFLFNTGNSKNSNYTTIAGNEDSKFKASSYFTTKPSTTATLSDTATIDRRDNVSNILRSRQLHLGKARIDLDSEKCKIKPKTLFS